FSLSPINATAPWMKTSEYPVSKTIHRRSTRMNAHHIIRKIIIARNREVPDLLEQYMEKSGETEQWITVQEFRAYFQLDEMYAPAISGFLRRIYHGPFFSCQYRVERIEKVLIHTPQRRYIIRYLVKKRPEPRGKSARGTQ
ncbi:MAG TPA: hypothetical protein PKM50_09530, partial [Methanoregula sp.]|nr:hypothetical protein [Methanoregula sp.]